MKRCSLKVFRTLTFGLFFSIGIIQTNWAQETDTDKWQSNFDQGIALMNSSDLQGAIPFMKTAYGHAKSIYTIDVEERIQTVFYLGYCYFRMGKNSDAIPYYEEVRDNLIEVSNINHQYYYVSLVHLSTMYRDIGSFSTAEEIYHQRLNYLENTKGTENSDYTETLIGLSTIYRLAGLFEKALETIESSLHIVGNIEGNESTTYALGLTSLCQIYGELSDYEKAIDLQKNAIEIFGKGERTSNNYVVAVLTLASLYDKIGEHHKAIALNNEVKSLFDENHGAHVAANNNMGQAYNKLGDYEKALKFSLESIVKTSSESRNYANRIQNLAFVYMKLGDFPKAEQSYDLALKAMEKTLGVAHPDYGKLLNNVGKLSFQMGDFDAALDFFDRALVNFLENFDENHKEYGYYLNDYAKTLIELGKIEEAILLMKKNLQIAESNEKTNDQAFFNKQYGLASAYISNKDFENALPLLKNATENIKGLIGADHPTYGRMMQSLGECLVGLGSIEEAIPVLEQSNQILISQLDKIFKFRSEDEKKAYLTIVLKNFDYLQSIAMGQSEKKERLTELNLNNQLMLKGLLLNNSKNILLKLNTLNDSEIDNKIISYRSKKNKLIKLLSAASSAEINTITKLKEEINTGETELVKLYNTFFKDDINLLKNWKDAKNKLKQGEVAIEFARFNYVQNNQSKDSILYVAYLYNKKLRTPLMIPLFSEKEMRIVLDKTTPSSLYRTRGSVANTRTNMNAIYNLIWEPLSAYLADVNTVYYAPSGLLFQISFAALGKKNEKLLSEQFELKQLSSTYNLTHEFAEPTLDNALLIGGVNYDYKTSVNKDTNEQHNSLDFKSLKNSSENRNWSGSWNYLPGTLKEITAIQEILNKENILSTSLTSSDASEENIKALHGNSPDILHIATHGFFFEDYKKKEQTDFNLENGNQYLRAHDPLLRSGIILAGANTNWTGNNEPIHGEDGILTAMEISNLDFSKTKIVVLSACETGLGDIDGSEGVYGLQRAFKMAGVQIIIMTLWQVPDLETAEFMKLFYNNWIRSGKVKEAFNLAQRSMKRKYSKEPHKWAAFVLFE